MGVLLCAAALRGGCTLPLTRTTALKLGFDGWVTYRANASALRAFLTGHRSEGRP